MPTLKAGISIVDRRARAFTLIEVLVALAIASIGLLGLMRLHLIGLNTAQAAAAQAAAVSVAQEKNAETCAGGLSRDFEKYEQPWPGRRDRETRKFK